MNPMFWNTFVIKRYLWIAVQDRFRCSGGMPSPGTPAEFITAVLCEICEDIAFRCVQAGPFSVNTEYIQCPFNHLCLIYEQKKFARQ